MKPKEDIKINNESAQKVLTLFRKFSKKPKSTPFNKVFNVIYEVLVAFLMLVAVLTMMSALQVPKNFRIFVVESGSMEPTIKAKSLIAVSPSKTYQEKDIISFKADLTQSKNKEFIITHRINEIKEEDGQTVFVTKGDANNTPDFNLVHKSQIIGEVRFILPFFGYIIGFAKTPIGFFIMIVIPASLIISSEILGFIYKKDAKKTD